VYSKSYLNSLLASWIPEVFRDIAGRLFSIALVMLFSTCGIQAATHHVESAEQVESLIKSGDLSAGDTILWADNDYSDVTLMIDGVNGTPSKPIALRAATPGKVILRGESRFHIGAQWWVIEGFRFDGREGEFNSYNAMEFRGRGGVGAQHVRLRNCAMTDLVAEGSSSKWILMFGRFNTIDHCHFSGKRSKGALITVELGYLGANETAGHRFVSNYFADFTPQGGTDNETIRIGYSGDQNKPASCLVERNYFFRCSGDNEIISNKSSFNTYRFNTFRQCDGALVLRHGHHARVEGNHFFGDGAKDAGGIRVTDSHHVILNNYLQDLTGTTWNSAFSIMGGKKGSGQTSSGYQAVDEIVVAHNSIINCRRSIFLNDAKGSRAPTGLMANNLIVSSSSPLILDELSCKKLSWAGNLFHGAAVGASVSAMTSDPQLRESEGLLRPDHSGPAVDAAVDIEISVEKDIDGQSRPKLKRDIGADEVVGALGNVSLTPLKRSDVGVSFLAHARKRAE
jgi:poly(beta-D-mannuronate) lyase